MTYQWTPTVLFELATLWQAGHTASDIADRLSQHGYLTRSSVLGQIHRQGYKRPSLEPSPQQRGADGRFDRAQALRRRQPIPPISPPIVTTVAPIAPIAPIAPVMALPAYDANASLATSQPVELKDLHSRHCRWPLGDPQLEAFRFCGAPKHLQDSYCARHHAMASQPYRPKPSGWITWKLKRRAA